MVKQKMCILNYHQDAQCNVLSHELPRSDDCDTEKFDFSHKLLYSAWMTLQSWMTRQNDSAGIELGSLCGLLGQGICVTLLQSLLS